MTEHRPQPSTFTIDPEPYRSAIEALCHQAFGSETVQVGRLTDVNRGRGAFSVVIRAELEATAEDDGALPRTVVAKLPVDGPNGAAAVAGGAYAREALAYRVVVSDSPVLSPTVHAIDEPGDGTAALLLEDLGHYRAVDQLDGLTEADAIRVAAALAPLHDAWRPAPRRAGLAVRHNTIAGLDPVALNAGLTALAERWGDTVDADDLAVFTRLVAAREPLVDRFNAATPTLCHGDPRADNLVFDHRDRVVMFDWQQLAVQAGEADLAWLAATSLDVEVRRRLDDEMIGNYGTDRDRYRLGFALPGLAVLMLAQREFPTERARRFAAVSLHRIGAAIADLEVADIGR